MAANIGEIYVQLGVDADIKPLEDSLKKMKEVVETINEEINANKRLQKYLKDLSTARNEAQKNLIKQNFAKEIEAERIQKNIKAGEKELAQRKEVIANTKKAMKGFAGIVTAISAAFYAINKLTDSLVAQNQEFLNLTRNSDIALGTFQKWNNIGRMFGVNNAAQQLANLNQRLFELKLTGEGADGFILAGINPLGADAEGVMEQLRNRIAGLDDTAATFLLNRMGLDPSMLHLLRMTRQEFEAYNEATKKYRLTEEQSKQLQMMNAQLEIAKLKFQYLKDQALLAIMPHLVKFMNVIAAIGDRIKQLIDWLNGDSAFAKFVKFILKAVAVFSVWVATVGALAKTFEILKLAIAGARIALLALTSHPIVAALTAVAGLIMWGVNKYQQTHGGQSFTGLPDMNGMNQSIDNRRYMSNIRNNNPQITMNNTIHTTEAARAVNDELMTYGQYCTFGYQY